MKASKEEAMASGWKKKLAEEFAECCALELRGGRTPGAVGSLLDCACRAVDDGDDY